MNLNVVTKEEEICNGEYSCSKDKIISFEQETQTSLTKAAKLESPSTNRQNDIVIITGSLSVGC